MFITILDGQIINQNPVSFASRINPTIVLKHGFMAVVLMNLIIGGSFIDLTSTDFTKIIHL